VSSYLPCLCHWLADVQMHFVPEAFGGQACSDPYLQDSLATLDPYGGESDNTAQQVSQNVIEIGSSDDEQVQANPKPSQLLLQGLKRYGPILLKKKVAGLLKMEQASRAVPQADDAAPRISAEADVPGVETVGTEKESVEPDDTVADFQQDGAELLASDPYEGAEVQHTHQSTGGGELALLDGTITTFAREVLSPGANVSLSKDNVSVDQEDFIAPVVDPYALVMPEVDAPEPVELQSVVSDLARQVDTESDEKAASESIPVSEQNDQQLELEEDAVPAEMRGSEVPSGDAIGIHLQPALNGDVCTTDGLTVAGVSEVDPCNAADTHCSHDDIIDDLDTLDTEAATGVGAARLDKEAVDCNSCDSPDRFAIEALSQKSQNGEASDDDDVEIVREDLVEEERSASEDSASEPAWLVLEYPDDPDVSLQAEQDAMTLDCMDTDRLTAEGSAALVAELRGACPMLATYLVGHPQALPSRKRKRQGPGTKGRYFLFEERSEDVMADKVVTGCWACGKLDHASNDCVFKRCFICSEQGHQFGDCDKKGRHCHKCGATGHMEDFCPHDEYAAGLSQDDDLFLCRCMKCGGEGHVNCGTVPALPSSTPPWQRLRRWGYQPARPTSCMDAGDVLDLDVDYEEYGAPSTSRSRLTEAPHPKNAYLHRGLRRNAEYGEFGSPPMRPPGWDPGSGCSAGGLRAPYQLPLHTLPIRAQLPLRPTGRPVCRSPWEAWCMNSIAMNAFPGPTAQPYASNMWGPVAGRYSSEIRPLPRWSSSGRAVRSQRWNR